MTRTMLKIAAVVTMIVPVSLAQAQKADKVPAAPDQIGHLETPKDPYVPAPREGQPRTPGARIERNGYVSVQVNVDENGDNIVGDAANEPTIAIDVTDPSRMCIGWRQFDTISSNFRQAGYGYTTDGGQSWTFPGKIEPGVFRSDPVLDSDVQGNFYYNSLTAEGSDYWCHVFKSTDGGATWDSGTYAYGGDKQWMIIDKTDGIGQGNMYAYWTQYWSICYPGHFIRSTDGGQSYESCITIPNSPQWGTLAVGPYGALFICGDAYTVVRSSNAQDPSQSVVWDLTSSPDLDGSMLFSGGPNPGGLLGQMWIATDHSDGPSHGNVYVCCSVSRNSTPDPLDFMFARSTDGGQTWSAPQRINQDESSSAYQWFGTMSVAPNGRIDMIWLDTRNDPGGYDSELFYRYSEDAGETWSEEEVLGPPFDPHVGWPQQNKMGDYLHMLSDNAGASLAYAATYNGEQDVYYIRLAHCTDAGTVDLTSNKYGCESTATIEVNDCGLNTSDDEEESVEVTIASDSESAGEVVLLTETGPSTALFSGSIELSTTDSPGVLQIVEGDLVTATYEDADDGGGLPVTVTDVASVDCTPPIISDVGTQDVEAREATVTFDTDEPCLGTVRYGLACGALTGSTTGAGYHTSHGVHLTGLEKNSTYYFVVDAEDEAGNTSTDDNGGLCYTFDTPDAPDFYTEQFESGFDLDGYQITFTPDGSNDFYHACVEEIDSLPTDPAGGTEIVLSDDDFETISLTGPPQVRLYGQGYSQFHVGGNGYITFSSGDSDYTETLAEHFSQPRISMLFDDLSPQNGTVSWKQILDRAVVTFEDVPEYSSTGSNTFQVEMYFAGKIVLAYLGVTANDGIVGLSEGEGLSPDYLPTDLSELGCYAVGDMNCSGVVDFFDIDGFVLAITDPAGYEAAYPDCDIMLADCNGDGVVNFFDIDVFVALITG